MAGFATLPCLMHVFLVSHQSLPSRVQVLAGIPRHGWVEGHEARPNSGRKGKGFLLSKTLRIVFFEVYSSLYRSVIPILSLIL
jgi:hypothetical protein